ncbi:MAG: ATP-binding cassette domain-containing protein [Lentisphaerae bacterium]|nr:ATP-binding cassette domain-containing protein [Lentisphaerota bacterium]
MALLSLKNVSLSYGGLPLLDGVELHVERGDRVCLLGANGAGKSSLLRVLAGESNPDSGEVVRPANLRVARLPQQVPSHLEGRTFDIVCPDPGDERSRLEASQILSRLSLDPETEFSSLSGGTKRRVLLASALIGSPEVVLLDEPTNHLDLDSIAWLETFLLRHCRTFLFVTHDRAFLRRLASRIVELDRGKLKDWACDYDTFLVRKEEALHAEMREWETLDRRLLREEAWKRQGVKARTVRNQGRLRALFALREERSKRRERPGAVTMKIQQAERTGRIVIKAEDVSFGYGGPGAVSPLIRDFSTVIVRGDRIGILGPNGCGKTSLLRLLLEPDGAAGRLVPQTGSVAHGTNLQIAYADQLRARLDDSQSLAENVGDGREFVMVQGVRRHVIGYLEDFLFTPDRARQPVGALSGGERNRLLLARLFAQPSNVLVLDEPTNDLDLDTLELLEEQLTGYTGTVLLVSHDRAFLNDVVTSVLAFEKHSPDKPDQWLGPRDGWYVNEYVGGYDEWAAQRKVPPEPAKAPRQAAVSRSEPGPRKKRLSDREKRELAELPGRIEALESEQTLWHARLADPAFYRATGEEIARARREAEERAAEIEAAYRRWETLESIVTGKQ